MSKSVNIDASWVLPVYREHFNDYKTRTEVYMGGASSGKSYFVMQKILVKTLMLQKRRVLILRKIGSSIRDSVWQLAKELLHSFPEDWYHIKKTEYIIEFSNGNQLIFRGLDDPERIKSIQSLTDIVMEEATEFTQDEYEQLILRLNRTVQPDNQIFLMFNPISKTNWVYNYFFKNGPPKWTKIIHTTYLDNPTLPQTAIENMQAMEKTNPVYYHIYALGEFGSLSKLVYPNVHFTTFTDEELENLHEKGWFWIGLDFGFSNDPTALSWGYYVPSTYSLYITGEYDKRGMLNGDICRKINQLGFTKERIIADSADPKSIEELKGLGLTRIKASKKGNDSVRAGVAKINEFNLYCDESRCPATTQEFKDYSYLRDKSTGEYLNTPQDCNNHHMDAIRYGIQSVENKKTDKDCVPDDLWLL